MQVYLDNHVAPQNFLQFFMQKSIKIADVAGILN